MIKVMAIDPGLTLGWAVVDRKDITHYSMDPSEILVHKYYEEKNYRKKLDERLFNIQRRIWGNLLLYLPDIVLLEELNLTFDRQHKNREDLQKYSAAWGVIYSTIAYRREELSRKYIVCGDRKIELHIIPIPKPNPRGKSGGRKKMIMKTVELNYKITGITDHEAEAIWWAMNYERRDDG